MSSQVARDPYFIPPEHLAEWQTTVDLMARLLGVPAGLIMRIADPDIEVLISSHTEGNPYHVGDREHLHGSGLYCETVINTQDPLLVPNALADEAWRQNPDVKLHMIAYLGYPIAFPDGTPFGTLCVLDRKENPFGDTQIGLLAKLRDLVQSQLALVYMNSALESENLRLIDAISEIKTLRGFIPICAHCKKIRSQDDYWEQLETYLTEHTEAQLTHGICPTCLVELYPEHAS